MSDTLRQFGEVLFDELEQITVRRGGFAGLQWVRNEVATALSAVDSGKATTSDATLLAQAASLAEKARRVAATVEGLAMIARARLATAAEVAAMTMPVVPLGDPPHTPAALLSAAREPLGMLDRPGPVAATVVEHLRNTDAALAGSLAAYVKTREVVRFIDEFAGKIRHGQGSDRRYSMEDSVEDHAREIALNIDTVGLAFSGGGIRSATFNLGVLQGLAALGLIKHLDYLSTVSGGGYIGSWFAAWVRREGGAAVPNLPPNDPKIPRLEREKGRRTEQALENVTLELDSSRVVEARAERRWVTPEEIAEGRIHLGDLVAPALDRVVEEEPEPVQHLRAFSNYLAPKLGITSVDTWTLISIYLRNLMLNQAILLPSAVAALFLPRFMLWAFGPGLPGSVAQIVGNTLSKEERTTLLSRLSAGASAVVFALLVILTWLAFVSTYRAITEIRRSRRPRTPEDPTAPPFEITRRLLWTRVIGPFAAVAVGVGILFSHPNRPFFDVPVLGALFNPQVWDEWLGSLVNATRSHEGQAVPTVFTPTNVSWLDAAAETFRRNPNVSLAPLPSVGALVAASLTFGLFTGGLRVLTYLGAEMRDPLHPARTRPSAGKTAWARLGRFVGILGPPFLSGLFAGAGLSALLSMLAAAASGHEFALLAPVMCTFAPPLVVLAIGVGSSVEVGLTGVYQDEDIREWRASLGAYLLMLACGWVLFASLSLFGPLFVWATGRIIAAAIAAGWLSASIFGVVTGYSAKTSGAKGGLMERLTLAAPPVFLVGLVVLISMLACALQGVPIPLDPNQSSAAVFDYWRALDNYPILLSFAIFGASTYVAYNACARVNVNLFGLNAFYANRLVRCYLGASRPSAPPKHGRSEFAPTNSPVPVRKPNPITGFDPSDDFPIKDLAIVRAWRDDDLTCHYRGPYQLVNTSMNLVTGDNLAWQERMAESFLLSPLYGGSKTTGYRRTVVKGADLTDDECEDDKDRGRTVDETSKAFGEVVGFGDDIRLGTAVSISGAAASPNMGYHSSPLVTILLTVFNARLGLWLGNPSRSCWRNSGPNFAGYLYAELLGRTSDKGDYVYLSDGGHFENLGVYELVRRRCRFIVVCDAGADPDFSFKDLGGLVRKCREDFGVRIDIDVGPLAKLGPNSLSKWHCAVGQIHYDDVDDHATPGTLFYLKPSLTGDEPSDVRNYVVEHPTFPHQTTANQFFSESQFESYRVLGEHIATEVFRDAVVEAGADAPPAMLFSKLRRRWFPPPPDLDKSFLEALKPFVEVQDALRSDPHLERLSHELYPELHAGLAEENPTLKAEVHAVNRMLHAMESAWLSLRLEGYSDHPMNRGWMNLFRRWSSTGVLQAHWPALRGEYSEGFVRFCENELNLGVSEPKVMRIGAGISRDDFEAAVRALDSEFVLEWPELNWPSTLGDASAARRAGLAELLEDALAPATGNPPRGLATPAAWLISPGPSSRRGGGGAATIRRRDGVGS